MDDEGHTEVPVSLSTSVEDVYVREEMMETIESLQVNVQGNDVSKKKKKKKKKKGNAVGVVVEGEAMQGMDASGKEEQDKEGETEGGIDVETHEGGREMASDVGDVEAMDDGHAADSAVEGGHEEKEEGGGGRTNTKEEEGGGGRTNTKEEEGGGGRTNTKEEEEGGGGRTNTKEEEGGDMTNTKEEEEGGDKQQQQAEKESPPAVVRKQAQMPLSPSLSPSVPPSLQEPKDGNVDSPVARSDSSTKGETTKVTRTLTPGSSPHSMVSSIMDSRKAWGGEVAKKVDGPRIESVIPYETLKHMRADDGVDMTRKEEYLAAHEFQEHFKQDIESFKKLPMWRQILLKKKVGLF